MQTDLYLHIRIHLAALDQSQIWIANMGIKSNLVEARDKQGILKPIYLGVVGGQLVLGPLFSPFW